MYTNDDPLNPTELAYSEWVSPPDTNELDLMDEWCLSQNFPQKELHRELERLWDLSETNSDGYESPLLCEDSFFSQ